MLQITWNTGSQNVLLSSPFGGGEKANDSPNVSTGGFKF